MARCELKGSRAYLFALASDGLFGLHDCSAGLYSPEDVCRFVDLKPLAQEFCREASRHRQQWSLLLRPDGLLSLFIQSGRTIDNVEPMGVLFALRKMKKFRAGTFTYAELCGQLSYAAELLDMVSRIKE